MNVNRGVRASFFKVALIAVVMSLFAVSCGGGEDDVQVESRIKNAAISNPGEAATEDQIEAECEFLADVRDESFDLDILDRFESLDYSDAKKLNKLDNDLNDRNSLRYDLSDLEDDLFDRRNDFSYDFRNGFQGYIQHLKDRIDLSDLRDLGVLRNDLSDLSDLFNRLKQYQKMEKWSAAKAQALTASKHIMKMASVMTLVTTRAAHATTSSNQQWRLSMKASKQWATYIGIRRVGQKASKLNQTK